MGQLVSLAPQLDVRQKNMQNRPPDEELRGMTVNERLYACGLSDRWEAAAHERNPKEMIQVLLLVALSEDQAKHTVDAVLENPKTYGF